MSKHYLSDLIPDDSAKSCFEIADKKLMYTKTENSEYITSSVCPHAGGDLCKGDMVGDVVTCPKHHLKFNLQTGENIKGADYHLKTYPVQSDEKGNYIEV